MEEKRISLEHRPDHGNQHFNGFEMGDFNQLKPSNQICKWFPQSSCDPLVKHIVGVHWWIIMLASLCEFQLPRKVVNLISICRKNIFLSLTAEYFIGTTTTDGSEWNRVAGAALKVQVHSNYQNRFVNNHYLRILRIWKSHKEVATYVSEINLRQLFH